MIAFRQVWKYGGGKQRRPLLAGANATFEHGRHAAILCRNEREIEVMAGLLSGLELPDRGRVHRRGRISWPVSDRAGTVGNMTVAQNLRFLARVHGARPAAVLEWVDEFVGLGPRMSQPVNMLEKRHKSLLSYATVLALPFDWYIFVGALKFKDDDLAGRVQQAFENRFSHASAMFLTDKPDAALQLAPVGAALLNGHFHAFESVAEAEDLMAQGRGRNG